MSVFPTDDPLSKILSSVRPEGLPVATPPIAGASPTYPSVAPSTTTAPPKKGGLSEILPLIAALYAAHTGGLPGYVSGLTDLKKSQEESAFKQGAARRDQEQIDISRQRADAEQAHYNAELAREDNARREKVRRDIEERVNRTFDNNPALEDQINQLGPEKFSIAVPGLGNLNLKEALDQIGAVTGPDGKYSGLGKRTAKDQALITGVDAKGRPTRVPDKPGTRVYEKPDKEPKATKRAYTWKDGDPESDTFGKSFRIIEDDNGNVVSQKPISGIAPMASHNTPNARTIADVKAALSAGGRRADDATAQKVLANPQAMAELFPTK